MNCYDCTAHGFAAPAVAVCLDCGAAVCADHAVLTPRWLTRTVPINCIVRIEPPTRTIRCQVCQTAHSSAHPRGHAATA